MDSDLMRWVKAQADDPNANPRFRELLAALEAAREDAGLWRQAFVNERARLNREHGMSIEQARIHAETDAEIAAIDQSRDNGRPPEFVRCGDGTYRAFKGGGDD